jgi:hypothetical protein
LLEKLFPAGWSAGRRKLVVHVDNALARNSRMTQNLFGHYPLKRLSHPSDSPNISPSDFYLFGKIKNELIGWEILDEIDLLEAVAEILNSISDVQFQQVNRNWIQPVESVIDAGGNYLTLQIFSSSMSYSRSTS